MSRRPAILTNQILVPHNLQQEYPHKPMPEDTLFHMTWYLKDFNHLWLLGNIDFGLLVLSRKPVQIEQDIYAAVKGCVPEDMPLENYLQEESYWESHKSIPKPLNKRMAEVEGRIRDRQNLHFFLTAHNQASYLLS